MSIRTPIDKQHLRNHMTYNGWKYVAVIIAVIAGWSLIYTSTAYRSPQDKRIDVYIKSGTVDQDLATAYLEPLWREVTPDMEVVDCVTLMPGDDYNSFMQLQVFVAAGEGDIYFLPESDFKSFAASESFVALDEYIANGVINAEGIDLTGGKVKVAESFDDMGNPVYGDTEYIFGIPMDSLYAFMDSIQLDNRGMVMCIAINNQNDENVIPFFNALLQEGRGEMPEWLQEAN